MAAGEWGGTLKRIFQNGNGSHAEQPRTARNGRGQPEDGAVQPTFADNFCDATVSRGVLTASTGPESMVFSRSDTRGPADESLRLLAHRLQRIRERRPMKTLVVTSASPKEGKTVVAVNLAATLAANSGRVALIDGDLRCAYVAGVLGVPVLPGFAECLEEEQSVEENLLPVSPLSFDLLQAGAAKRNPAELLQGPRLKEVAMTLGSKYDWIVIDTPPLTPFVDAQCLAAAADAVIVVVRAGHTSRDSIARTLESLKDVYVAGIVLNGADAEHSPYYKYYSQYRSNGALAAAAVSNGGRAGHD